MNEYPNTNVNDERKKKKKNWPVKNLKKELKFSSFD